MFDRRKDSLLPGRVGLKMYNKNFFLLNLLAETILLLQKNHQEVTPPLFHFVSARQEQKLNLFGQPVEKCGTAPGPASTGYCDGGDASSDPGLHQICASKLPGDFSTKTNQGSNWSEEQSGKHWCICIWAYSGYVSHIDPTISLQCSGIPESALSENYLANWKSGSLPGEVKKGVESLMKTCLVQASDEEQKQHLVTLYTKLQQRESQLAKPQELGVGLQGLRLAPHGDEDVAGSTGTRSTRDIAVRQDEEGEKARQAVSKRQRQETDEEKQMKQEQQQMLLSSQMNQELPDLQAKKTEHLERQMRGALGGASSTTKDELQNEPGREEAPFSSGAAAKNMQIYIIGGVGSLLVISFVFLLYINCAGGVASISSGRTSAAAANGANATSGTAAARSASFAGRGNATLQDEDEEASLLLEKAKNDASGGAV
ncbi:unnamed protein product [Amoebophrya sp. A120]|nr:unnamed protein product [Amoebophrya sp. A120]|eukprot:GSA120T00019293001.1